VLEYIDGGDLLDHIMDWPSEDGRGLREFLWVVHADACSGGLRCDVDISNMQRHGVYCRWRRLY
jgi:hypothetical protein